MLITETRLRSLIRSELIRVLNEQGGTDVRSRKTKKNIRKLKKSSLSQAASPKEKKEIRQLIKFLKKYRRGQIKYMKMNDKQEEIMTKIVDKGLLQDETENLENKYKRLESNKKDVLNKLIKGKKDLSMEDILTALAALNSAKDTPIKTAEKKPPKKDDGPEPEAKEKDTDPTSAANLAAVSSEEKSKRGKIGKEFDIGEKWKYKITDDDNRKIQQNGKLHFTVSSGPSNVGKSFQIKDSGHSIVAKVKELFPHLKQWI